MISDHLGGIDGKEDLTIEARAEHLIGHNAGVTNHGYSLDDLIEAVPWSRLAHAYDVALDAPARLRALAASVEGDSSESLDELEDWFLWTVVHQGTPYSATAPVLWIARRILGLGSTHPALAWCLLAIAESVTALRFFPEADHPGIELEPERSAADEPLWAAYLPPGRELRQKHQDRVEDDYFLAAPADVPTLRGCVLDWEQTVLDCLRDRRFLDEAIDAAAAMVRLAPSPGLTHSLSSFIDGPEDIGRRAESAFALAASSRATPNVEELLDHENRAIRVAAALGCPDHPRALKILVGAVEDRTWVSATFPQGFVGPEPWLTAALLDAVLDRVSIDVADARLVGGLEQQLATVGYGPLGATYEWGRVLAWLFPERWQQTSYIAMPSPDSLSSTQRRLLTALVHNDDPWEQGAGNASLALGQVGLPHDRAMVAALAGMRIPGRRSWWRP